MLVNGAWQAGAAWLCCAALCAPGAKHIPEEDLEEAEEHWPHFLQERGVQEEPWRGWHLYFLGQPEVLAALVLAMDPPPELDHTQWHTLEMPPLEAAPHGSMRGHQAFSIPPPEEQPRERTHRRDRSKPEAPRQAKRRRVHKAAFNDFECPDCTGVTMVPAWSKTHPRCKYCQETRASARLRRP